MLPSLSSFKMSVYLCLPHSTKIYQNSPHFTAIYLNVFETISDTTSTAVALKLILFCILCVKNNLRQRSLCWKNSIFPKSKSEEKVKYLDDTCTSALVLRPTSYGKSGGEPIYLHFCSGQRCWVLTSSLPPSLLHLSHQLLQMHRGQRQMSFIIYICVSYHRIILI